jgi:hypothetical protein
MMSDLDRAVLAAYCQTYGRWVEAERRLAETPALIKLPSGYVQQNPWLAVSNKQLQLMAKLLSEIGLTPVSPVHESTRSRRRRIRSPGSSARASSTACLAGATRMSSSIIDQAAGDRPGWLDTQYAGTAIPVVGLL